MGLILFMLVSSALLLGVFAVAAWLGGARAVTLLSFPALFFTMCAMSLMGMQQVLMTLVAGLVCWSFGLQKRWLFAGCVVAAVIACGGRVGVGYQQIQRYNEARERLPFVSLVDRLAFERKPDNGVDLQTPIQLSGEVERRLESFEAGRDYGSRAWQLNALHNRTADTFIKARGFGPVRMREVRLNELELEEPPLVPLPSPDEYSPDMQLGPGLAPLAMTEGAEVGSWELKFQHDAGVKDLLDLDRMGFVQNRASVTGFQSHAFSRIPKVESETANMNQWRVARLELVGIARHEEPVAYVADHLPNMRELAGAETRPLDPFETSAVEKLRADQDVVIDQQAQRIRMVGALRAANDCLQCHEVRRGALLGGLSYELVPKTAPAAPEPPHDAVSLQ